MENSESFKKIERVVKDTNDMLDKLKKIDDDVTINIFVKLFIKNMILIKFLKERGYNVNE